jgi:hypothetical protein
VKLNLVPQDHVYYELFCDFAVELDQAACLLVSLLADESLRKSAARRLLEHEHVGDKIVHDIVSRLARTLVTPFEPKDIYDLAACLDEVMDALEATADLLVLYRVARATPWAMELAQVVARQVTELRKAPERLEGRAGLQVHWIEVHRLENEGDRLCRDALAGLFDDDLGAAEIIKWKDIYACDACEDVANVVETVVMKRS